MHLAHVITLTSWLKVSSVRIRSIHMPSMILHFLACVVCPRFLSLLFISHCPPVLCPAQLPQCRHRRGLKPLHSRTMRSFCTVAIYNPLTGLDQAVAQVSVHCHGDHPCVPQMKTSSSKCAKNCGVASLLSKLCSPPRSAVKSTQRVPARLRPYTCFRSRQSTEVRFSNAACCSSHSSSVST